MFKLSHSMKRILLFSVFFATSAVSAQPGSYIVKQSGDTIPGKFIINTKQVLLVKPASKDTMAFNSEDIWQAVEGSKVRWVLRLTLYGYTDNVETVMQPGYSDPVYDTTILLRPLILGGHMNLFAAKDKRKVVYFFVQGLKDSVPVQLLYSVGGHMPEKSNWSTVYQFISYLNRYRIFEDQLRDMTRDCDSFSDVDFELLQYLESSMKNFVKRYNKCK